MTKLTAITVSDLNPGELEYLIDILEDAWNSDGGPAKPDAVREIYEDLVDGRVFRGKSLRWESPNLLGDLLDAQRAR